MRKVKITVLSLLTTVMLFGSASVFASGFPFGVLTTSGSTKIVVLGDFSSVSGQFTQEEAQNLTATVAPIIQSLLTSSSSSVEIEVLTPNQLRGYDADTLKLLVKSNYKAWGYNTYIFVNITKKAEYVAGFGPNMRLDVYIADMASLIGVSADYLYATSIEVPYMYASILNSF
jgi:hypothetical protein